MLAFHKALIVLLESKAFNEESAVIFLKCFPKCTFTLDQIFSIIKAYGKVPHEAMRDDIVAVVLERLIAILEESGSSRKTYELVVNNLHLLLALTQAHNDLVSRTFSISLFYTEHLSGMHDVLVKMFEVKSQTTGYQRALIYTMQSFGNNDYVLFLFEQYLKNQKSHSNIDHERCLFLNAVIQCWNWESDTVWKQVHKLMILCSTVPYVTVGDANLREKQIALFNAVVEKLLNTADDNSFRYDALAVVIRIEGSLLESHENKAWTVILTSKHDDLMISWLEFHYKTGSTLKYIDWFLKYENELKLQKDCYTKGFLFKIMELTGLLPEAQKKKLSDKLSTVEGTVSIVSNWILSDPCYSAVVTNTSKKRSFDEMAEKSEGKESDTRIRKENSLYYRNNTFLEGTSFTAKQLVERIKHCDLDNLKLLHTMLTTIKLERKDVERVVVALLELKNNAANETKEFKTLSKKIVLLLASEYRFEINYNLVLKFMKNINEDDLQNEIDFAFLAKLLRMMSFGQTESKEVFSEIYNLWLKGDAVSKAIFHFFMRQFADICNNELKGLYDKIIEAIEIDIELLDTFLLSDVVLNSILLCLIPDAASSNEKLMAKICSKSESIFENPEITKDDSITEKLCLFAYRLTKFDQKFVKVCKQIIYENPHLNNNQLKLDFAEDLVSALQSLQEKSDLMSFFMKAVLIKGNLPIRQASDTLHCLAMKYKFQSVEEVIMVAQLTTLIQNSIKTLRMPQCQAILIIQMKIIMYLLNSSKEDALWTHLEIVENASKQLVSLLKSSYATSIIPVVVLSLDKLLTCMRVNSKKLEVNDECANFIGESILRMFSYLCSSSLREITRKHIFPLVKQFLHNKKNDRSYPPHLKNFITESMFLMLSTMKPIDLEIMAARLDLHSKNFLQGYHERYLVEYKGSNKA